MKRSRINTAITEFEDMARAYRVALPPFSHFSPEDWADKGRDYDEIRDVQLGWSVTDFGAGDFDRTGCTCFTLRSGSPFLPWYQKPYTQRLLYLTEGQRVPMHFHWSRMADVSNRAGGVLVVRVCSAAPSGKPDLSNSVHVHVDGRELVVPAGAQIRLSPGESITIHPHLYHEFTVEGCPVILDEIGPCMDEDTDSKFEQKSGGWFEIQEDVPPCRLLASEYPGVKEEEA